MGHPQARRPTQIAVVFRLNASCVRLRETLNVYNTKNNESIQALTVVDKRTRKIVKWYLLSEELNPVYLL